MLVLTLVLVLVLVLRFVLFLLTPYFAAYRIVCIALLNCVCWWPLCMDYMCMSPNALAVLIDTKAFVIVSGDRTALATQTTESVCFFNIRSH